MTKIAYIGNFQPEVTDPKDRHSTENHIAQALDHLGHDVSRLQENDVAMWRQGIKPEDYDLILWTRTVWPWEQYGVSHLEIWGKQLDMLLRAERCGVPTVGYHLDFWWSLPRERDITSGDPFFKVSLLITADGGHDDKWKEVGINHVWLPPGVSEFECVPAEPNDEFVSDIAFVGSWNGYHPEWTHRAELVGHLQDTYGDRCKFWPQLGHGAVRGEPLRALYASTKVNVGDSCLMNGARRYWSDRVPETLGRGGFLLHPYVEGMGEHFADAHHLVTWQLGDWEQLDHLIEYYLVNETERKEIAAAGREHVLKTATYTKRMQTMIDLVGGRV